MKPFFKSMVIPLLLASISACSKESIPVKTEEPPVIAQEATKDPRTIKQEPPAESKVSVQHGEPAEEIPFDYTAMKEPAVIRLNEDPRIETPTSMSILLAPRAYDFTIFFKEPMQQKSVEEVLQKKASEVADGYPELAVSYLKFQWANNRQLHLTVDVIKKEVPDLYSRRYTVNVNGAQTMTGEALQGVTDLLVTLHAPEQIYKLSLDSQLLQPLTSFKNPYVFEPLDTKGSFYLLSQFQRFCACDAGYPKLYSIYDAAQKRIIPYPVELSTHYLGKGNFVADRRGFFYPETDAGGKMTESPSAMKIRRDGYIYGANFSRDHDMLIYAVGKEGVEKDPQIVIRNLATGSEQTIGTAQGAIPRGALNGELEGIRFIDDGQNVYFALRGGAGSVDNAEKRYMFSWRTKQLKPWNPPVPPEAWSNFTQSSDRMYQMYVNAGLYKGTERIDDQMNIGEVWIPGTHLFTKRFIDDKLGSNSNARTQIRLFDADKKESRTIASQLPDSTKVIGASQDGKWIYLTSMQSLAGSH